MQYLENARKKQDFFCEDGRTKYYCIGMAPNRFSAGCSFTKEKLLGDVHLNSLKSSLVMWSNW